MRGFLFSQRAVLQVVLVGLGLSLAGCAGRTPPPENPASVEATSDVAGEPKTDAETGSMESASSGQSLDVGMEFKDKGDNENRRANREAPPTSSWKPVGKDKAADPKKGTVTAAR